MASRYQPLTVIYFVFRLCSHHWLRYCSRLERGKRTGYVRHARLHGTWSDVPPKPHDLGWLFRCRCHGLRMHVWTRKFHQLSIDSIRYNRLFSISKIPPSPYHYEFDFSDHILARAGKRSVTTSYPNRSRSSATTSHEAGPSKQLTSSTR